MHKKVIRSLLFISVISLVLPSYRTQKMATLVKHNENIIYSNNYYISSLKDNKKPEILISTKEKKDINIVSSSINDTLTNNIVEKKQEIKNKNKKQEVIKNVLNAPNKITSSKEIEQSIESSTNKINLTNYEVELIALLTMAEAGGESELGKRLVIDTVLNQLESDDFPNTVNDVVYSGAFISMYNGRSNQCYVDEEICRLVREEAISRTNTRVLYFRTRHYHNFGTPEIHEGNHYFSS